MQGQLSAVTFAVNKTSLLRACRRCRNCGSLFSQSFALLQCALARCLPYIPSNTRTSASWQQERSNIASTFRLSLPHLLPPPRKQLRCLPRRTTQGCTSDSRVPTDERRHVDSASKETRLSRFSASAAASSSMCRMRVSCASLEEGVVVRGLHDDCAASQLARRSMHDEACPIQHARYSTHDTACTTKHAPHAAGAESGPPSAASGGKQWCHRAQTSKSRRWRCDRR